MKKKLYSFALVGMFTLLVPLAANAYTKVICGNICLCWDLEDEANWREIFCPETDAQV